MYINKVMGIALLALSYLSLSGQTEVKRYDVTAETGYGVVYRLPKTQIVVEAIEEIATYTPGEFQPWAMRYLRATVQAHESREHKLKEVRLRVVGLPDEDKQYLIAFDKKTVAPFVYLGLGDIIYSINGREVAPPVQPLSLPSYPAPDRGLPSFPREYSLSTTKGKQVEIASAYLFEVRENVANILSGSLEQMPKDGESMRLVLDRLRLEEERTLRLFLGDTVRSARSHKWSIDPEEEDMTGRMLFRFSSDWGIVDADDLSGDPVYLDVKIVDRAPILDDKAQKKHDKLEGIIFNKPGLAEVTLRLGDKILAKELLPLTQVGTTQSLAKKMFNIKDSGEATAVYFDPRTGAIDRISGDNK